MRLASVIASTLALFLTPAAIASEPLQLIVTEQDDPNTILIPAGEGDVTIIVDMRDLRYCGNGRVVERARKSLSRKAMLISRRLANQNRSARIVTLTRDQRLNAGSPAVLQRC